VSAGVKAGFFEGDAEYVPPEINEIKNTMYKGSCNLPSSGSCSVQNLNQIGNNCFGSDVNAMSMICMRESQGKPTASSGTDVCKSSYGGKNDAWSYGLFQINLMANGSAMGCGKIIEKSTVGAQTRLDRELGTCIGGYKPIPNSNLKYCTIRNCWVTDRAGYNSCVTKATNPTYNVKFACNLYQKSTPHLKPWGGSAGRCGL
jgi:hypothetical protein